PAAHEVLRGLAGRHPSRTIVLVPEPDAGDGMEATVDQQSFPLAGSERSICTETIEVRLGGEYASRPASIVAPLLIADLPVFCRWRGEPPWGAPEFEQLVELVDRMVIDSREWREPAAGYKQVAEVFDRVLVSDIAWSLTYEWRVKLAQLWPTIAEQEIRVRGPAAEASLLRAWLGARLRRAMRPVAGADELAKGCTGRGVIVEIGSWKGKSTICLGLGSRAGHGVRIVAVDPHADYRFGDFKANVERAGIADLVTPVPSLSQDAAAGFDE